MNEKVILTILDGLGLSDNKQGNAVSEANTENIDHYFTSYPFTVLNASGLSVGLPEGLMGNSEVGHLNIGAGRIVYQDLTRIDTAIENGSFFENAALNNMFDYALSSGKRVHLMGLFSDGGVHSHITHVKALFELSNRKGFKDVTVHCFMDGRDTPPDSGVTYMEDFGKFLDNQGFGEIGVVTGRYFAMDRDKRWDRVKKACDALTGMTPATEDSGLQAVRNAYSKGETDEFISPVRIKGSHSIQEGDAVIFFNFRADRARELTHALVDKSFEGFERQDFIIDHYATFTHYEDGLPVQVAFDQEELKNTLGEVISDNRLKQLRIAETEKYAHVTFFFSGGEEKVFDGEDRVLISSPDVATYDLKPEMSALEVTEEVIRRLDSDQYDLIILNFANCDMVGHTGDMDAAVKAVECVNKCVGNIVDTVCKKGWTMMITADHGNSEQMEDENGKPFTAHTTNVVPFCLLSETLKNVTLKQGALKDIAPTILHVMGIQQPAEMTGESLIVK